MAYPVSTTIPGGATDMVIIDYKHPLSTTNPELAGILKKLKPTISEAYKKATGKTHETKLKAVGYATQVVAGMNYYVKFRVDCSSVKRGEEYVHAQIYSKVWENIVELTSLAVNKSASDPVTDV
ncbi:hypothetical protein BGZ76_001127 [Entomortierella beljakovae]|nr:hypothetical protein BGZ76_001127 [Entomortierella beljakovae]